MPTNTTLSAFLYTLLTGVVLWALSTITSNKGWILSRRTEREKMDEARRSALEQENVRLRDLVQELREEILSEQMLKIGSQLTPVQQRLLTYTVDQLKDIEERHHKDD